MRSTRRVIMRLCFTALVLVTIGCGPSVHYQTPSYENQSGLSIKVQSVKYDDDQLQLRLFFENHTPQTMVVNRDTLTVRLPDGSVRTRERHEAWLFGAVVGDPTHLLPPNGGHEVFLDYRMKPMAGPIALQLAGITLDGQPAQFPDYVVMGDLSK
jgi:hypothetical protein